MRRSCHPISRSTVSMLLLAALSAGAFAADAITLDDLAGAAVEANINRRQKIDRDGRAYFIQARQNWSFDINADNTIDMTVNTTYESPRGTQKAPPNSGRFSLEESRDVSSRGGGQGVWNFADGALHFTRTFPSGAYRAHFTFVRSEGGISCEVTEAFAREDGKKPITLASPVDGAPVSIIESKQEPSDCKVKPAKPQ
jgi:hypothetical protein